MSGRGGRGRGRGRGGRGGAGGRLGPTAPVLKGVDAETNAASKAAADAAAGLPPPLFPGISNMAEPAPLSAYDRRLIAKTTLMRRRYRSSGYYTRLRSKERGASDLEGFRDSRFAEPQRAALMATSAFFPTELSGDSLRARKGASRLLGAAAMEQALKASEQNLEEDDPEAIDELLPEDEVEAFDNDDYTQDYYYDDADDNGGAFGEDAEGGGFL